MYPKSNWTKKLSQYFLKGCMPGRRVNKGGGNCSEIEKQKYKTLVTKNYKKYKITKYVLFSPAMMPVL